MNGTFCRLISSFIMHKKCSHPWKRSHAYFRLSSGDFLRHIGLSVTRSHGTLCLDTIIEFWCATHGILCTEHVSKQPEIYRLSACIFFVDFYLSLSPNCRKDWVQFNLGNWFQWCFGSHSSIFTHIKFNIVFIL